MRGHVMVFKTRSDGSIGQPNGNSVQLLNKNKK